VARGLAENPDGFLIVCNPDGEFLPGLQTRIKTCSALVIQIHTRVVEVTLCDGMKRRTRGEIERYDGAVARSEV